MRRTRVLVETALEPGATITLPEQAARHLVQVLRLKAGHEFIAFDGRDDTEYLAVLESVGKKAVTARILDGSRVERESPLELTLVQAISAAERMDYALQKAVELGVKRIIPVWSERSQRRLKPAQMEKKQRHWRGVIAHATEQSGRTRLAHLAEPSALQTVVGERNAESPAIVLDPTATRSLKQVEAPDGGMEIFIGPEGGFSDTELAMMEHAGIARIRMGPRILRTETAGPAVLAWLQTRYGDLG